MSKQKGIHLCYRAAYHTGTTLSMAARNSLAGDGCFSVLSIDNAVPAWPAADKAKRGARAPPNLQLGRISTWQAKATSAA